MTRREKSTIGLPGSTGRLAIKPGSGRRSTFSGDAVPRLLRPISLASKLWRNSKKRPSGPIRSSRLSDLVSGRHATVASNVTCWYGLPGGLFRLTNHYIRIVGPGGAYQGWSRKLTNLCPSWHLQNSDFGSAFYQIVDNEVSAAKSKTGKKGRNPLMLREILDCFRDCIIPGA